MKTVAELNALCEGTLPALLGIRVTHASREALHAELIVRPDLMAPNGFLHAGSVVALADTSCGNGCITLLPEGASGFTTIELKSNHLGTTRDGTVVCVARPAHLGRTTQVWDAMVTHKESGKTLALFRCTQMILYPK